MDNRKVQTGVRLTSLICPSIPVYYTMMNHICNTNEQSGIVKFKEIIWYPFYKVAHLIYFLVGWSCLCLFTSKAIYGQYKSGDAMHKLRRYWRGQGAHALEKQSDWYSSTTRYQNKMLSVKKGSVWLVLMLVPWFILRSPAAIHYYLNSSP